MTVSRGDDDRQGRTEDVGESAATFHAEMDAVKRVTLPESAYGRRRGPA